MWMLAVAALTCAPIDPAEGSRLVSLVPKVAATAPGPTIRFMRLEDGQRLYRVSGAGGLVGWYAVDLYSYLVRNWTAPDWPVETDAAIQAEQRRLTMSHCRGGEDRNTL